ncbi:hypothetical protein C8Q79DRAFT_135773 [Trametes meyenii]|nr:hypothetical protein C8Q79DRAFT_135773 [Trametes meyenii]
MDGQNLQVATGEEHPSALFQLQCWVRRYAHTSAQRGQMLGTQMKKIYESSSGVYQSRIPPRFTATIVRGMHDVVT